ncbi:MAG: RIP metalloprotease RseP [Elusimicrobiota bacterium]|jgi:regulator of sigma E protease|nr:RIP metalloprotease RseP [Elusimicrobiota bacterium]
MSIIVQILGIIIGFGFLVFIHELGHFFAAKMCKVHVRTFAFGFGPDIIKYNYKETKYCIKLIPFGGLVSMSGDNPDNLKGEKGEYLSLPWFKKIWVSFAGPFANYILAIIIFAFSFNIWGISEISKEPKIGSLLENYPAALAKLQAGDKINYIDGIKINSWDDLANNLKDKANREATFVIERGTYTFEQNITVGQNPVTKSGALGINPIFTNTPSNFFNSIYAGAKVSINQTFMTIDYLASKIISMEKPDIAGPIGVMQVMAKAAKSGMQDYLRLLAIISVALGLFNLFPIPMVDGGMIVLFAIEGIIRKKIKLKIIQIYNTIGLIFVILIFLFATYSDFLRLGITKFFIKQ